MQILFDPLQYAALEREAAARRQSVAALIREAVDARLSRPKLSRSEALRRLLDSAESKPSPDPIDWEAEKDSFEREYLRDLP